MKHKIMHCPTCNYEMDASTPIGEDKDVVPKENDISICFKCREILMFDKDLNPIICPLEVLDNIRKFQPEDFVKIMMIKLRMV